MRARANSHARIDAPDAQPTGSQMRDSRSITQKLQGCPRGLRLAFVAIALGLAFTCASAAPAQAPTERATTDLSTRLSLARLVDLAANQAGTTVDYAPAELEKVTVAVRLSGAIAPEALWELANQLLAQNGFTTVRAAGAQSLSVVKIADAAGIARIEEASAAPSLPPAGFESRLVELGTRPSKETIEALKLLVSKPGGVVTPVGDQRQVVISDLRPRLEQAIWVATQLDAGSDAAVVERIATKHLSAVQLAAMVTSAIEAQKGISARPIRGTLKVAPAGDDSTLLLVAPREEVAYFHELLAQFDLAGEVRTLAYSPRGFDLEQVAKLVEETVRERGPRGAGDRWRVAIDPLSDTLIVTATPFEHEQVKAAMDRLARLPSEARIPVRTYPIRNRSVEEIAQLLRDLVAAGVLAADTSFAEETPFDPSVASQRTVRDVLPAGATPLVEDAPLAASGAAASGVASTSRGRRAGSAGAGGSASGGGGASGGGAGGGSGGGLSITADKATNTLIASGEPRLLAQLESLLKTLDVRQPQVMLEVLVLSLNDSDTLDLGVELETLIQSGDTFIRLASLFGLGPVPLLPPVGGAIPNATGQGGTALVLRPGDYGVLVRALETMNEGRALNVPRVLVNNNEQGTLDATLQIPYISTNASTTVATTSFGGTDSAGTTVTIRPQIAAGDHMRLEYAVSLSSFVGAASSPSVPPPKQQNSLQSVVTVPDGHTVALGGLEIRSEGEATTQVPFIGDVPGVGELFKKRSKTSNRTRFFVFITPQVLRREGFEDLRHLSGVELRNAGLDDRFPKVEAQVIR